MLLKTAEDFNKDLGSSWMVGDGENDIKAGKTVGCKKALIEKGDHEQDITIWSLSELVDVNTA